MRQITIPGTDMSIVVDAALIGVVGYFFTGKLRESILRREKDF
jgi:hypothetical protein